MLAPVETDVQGGKLALFDIAALVFCTIVWGTTWYAITLQLGAVDAVASVVYRFGLAAAVLFAWLAVRRERLWLSGREHLAVVGVGVCIFSVNYVFVYWAEERIASAVAAVIFAAMAFINLVLFRVAFGERAAPAAWLAAALGISGVAVLSWGEIRHAQFGAEAGVGVGLALVGMIGAALGNAFAHRKVYAAIPVAASTAWAMLYGTLALAAFALITGRSWAFTPTPGYVGSLIYLSLAGSVAAFLFYFMLARRRGFTLASYISALTPPIAMGMSALFEDKSWSALALGGVGLILAGQWLLLGARRPEA
ncbi:MAG: EamA family transporter [Hyphomonadaceae bacterium]|nr:EamA family transporter [Hyphomonadaceae bacterium]